MKILESTASIMPQEPGLIGAYKQIEKVEHVKILGKNYDLSKFNYDEKLQVLNDKLASVLQKARELIQNSRQPKQC